ncbi:MAG: histidine kinase dimerization/phospho-acceptor domain-containing protein [Planctomycetota bacterium]
MKLPPFVESLFRSIPDSVILISPTCQILYANPASIKRLSSKEKEIIGKECHFLCHQYDHGSDCPVQEILQKRQIQHHKVFCDLPNQEILTWEITLFPMIDENNQVSAIVEYGRESSPISSLERELWQVDKMASIGAITAGLVHEINNPLGIILGYTQNLMALHQNSDLIEDLQVIEHEVLRCSQIIRNLMTFAKGSSSQKETILLKEVVQKIGVMLEYQLKKRKIYLEIRIENDVEVIADSLQIQQVFLNIFLYLIPTVQENQQIIVMTQQKKYGVEIFIQSQGKLPPEVVKGISKSSTIESFQAGAFGLFVAKRIIEEHLGTFEISTQNQQTHSRIFLPD